MDTHEISRDGPKSAAVGDAPASSADVGPTPRMALASVQVPASETPVGEMPTMALASIEAPNISPDLDELKSAAGEEAADQAADDAADESTPPQVSRFTLLAATLALAAALGGMVGALVAYGLARPGSPSTVASPQMDLAEIQTLKENVVQARVDLAALKVSIESAARNTSAQFTRMGERIERLQGEPAAKLNKAIDTLERLSRDAAAAQAKEVTGSIVPPPAGRPAEGWVVRDVRRGTALIEGRMGVIEVEQGDFVPGLGRVDAIRKQDGRWVVVTSKGVIMPGR